MGQLRSPDVVDRGLCAADLVPPCIKVRARIVNPPYDGTAPAERTRTTRGAVVVVDGFEATVEDLEVLETAIQTFRRSISLPVVLRLENVSHARWVSLVCRAREVGFNSVVLGGAPLRESLRDALTVPSDLPRDWLRWLQVRRLASPDIAECLFQVVSLTPKLDELGEAFPRLEVSPRTLAYRLRGQGLPKLERWFHASRIVYADVDSQRSGTADLHMVATQLVYSDLMSYSNVYYRLFGITPSRAWPLLGLEWRLHEWWRRSARSSHGDDRLGG